MADITFSMSADEKDVLRALNSVSREQGKLRDQINSLAGASREAGAADVSLLQARMTGLAALIEKQKGLKTQQADLKQQLEDGKISAQDYSNSMAKLAAESNDLTTAMASLRSEVNEDTADMKKAVTVIGQVEDKTERYARAVRELDRLKAKGLLTNQQYTKAIVEEQAQLSQSTDTVTGKTGNFTGALNKLSGVAIGSVGVLQQIASELKKLGDEMANDVQQYDKLSRKLGIQGGLSDTERRAQSRKVGQVAIDAGVTIDKAFETATQLSSSGFEDPVKGGTLNSALALMQSSNQIDGDAASFIKGSGQFMTAFGMKKNQANLLDLGVRMQGLFKSTDVQAADLPEFAKAAPVLSGAGLNLETSLSALTALRETMNAGEAATGARNVVSLLQTAGANKTASDALAGVGLRPEQIDIQGEGLKTALETLKAATAKLGDADRSQVLTKVFGRENVAAASILMDSTEKFDKFATMQREAAGNFRRDVGTARTGAAADTTRAEVQKQMQSVDQEDFVREQESLRLARVNMRDRWAKQELAKGTLAGRFNAGAAGIGGAIDDWIVRPLMGEEVLGAAHAKEAEKLRNEGATKAVRELDLQMPAPALQVPPRVNGIPQIEPLPKVEAMPRRRREEFTPDARRPENPNSEVVKALDKLTQLTERNAAQQRDLIQRSQHQQQQAAHAGVVAARAREAGQ